MKCPRCEVELESKQSDGFPIVDVCPRCEGVWFDAGELDDLDDDITRDVEAIDYRPAPGARDALGCPCCDDAKLEGVSPPLDEGLVLDRCGSCGGFWLDAGELEGVRQLAMAMLSDERAERPLLVRPPDWSWLRWRVHLFKWSLGSSS